MRATLLALAIVVVSAAGFVWSRTALVAPFCAAPESIRGGPPSADRPLRVLFIGNSFVFVNDLPGMLEAMAQKSVPPIRTERVVAPGATLQMHWESGEALRLIRSCAWDYVVLQEQSQMPMRNRRRMAQSVEMFNTEIFRQGARTILLMTWADADRPQDQAEIAAAYEAIGAHAYGASVAPAGVAFQTAMAERPAENLYASDKHHPGIAGTYLAAAVLYRLIEGTAPQDTSAAAPLSADEAGFLRGIAAKLNVATARR